MFIKKRLVIILLSFGIFGVQAKEISVNMHTVTDQGIGNSIGHVIFKDSQFGLLIVPDLEGLSPGKHGMHIHQNPSCDPDNKDGNSVAALAAGGHLDPANTEKHEGPYDSDGHLGDLPVLFVGDNSNATTAVLAPKLTVDDLKNHSIIIHMYGDNYSDKPKPLGGGGDRVACGVIAK